MGYDIYVNKEKASSVGIEARIVGTMACPTYYTNEEGYEVILPPNKVDIYGIFVDEVRVECTNIWVCEEKIGWRSGPTDEVYKRLNSEDYVESY